MKYIIIGLGNFGTNLGLRLRDLDHEVIGIDTRESIVEEYKDKLTGTVCMNSVDEASLRSPNKIDIGSRRRYLVGKTRRADGEADLVEPLC